MTCPVTAYARAVVAGEIVAGRLVRLAAERHLRDLKDGPARGLRWDAEEADRACRFFGCFALPDGRPFKLEPFQVFIVGSVFGWKGPDGFRRFRTAFVEMGKGNGKSPLAAGVGLYGLIADGEAAAEVYSAAVTREQAGILFRDAKMMVQASTMLSGRLDVLERSIVFGDSFFRPVSSEHRGLDGKRPHVCLLDEVHEHPTSLVCDKMRAGTKTRKQALIFEITNSGYDRTTVCWNHHEYSVRVLEGVIENDTWFAYVCTLDPCDECRAAGLTQPADACPKCDQWTDERTWLKANPGLDTILPRKYLREQVAEAQGIPAKRNLTLRLNFCRWTEAENRAIPQDQWQACTEVRDVDALAWRDRMLEELRGEECYGGLDLASKLDLTGFVALFPPRAKRIRWLLLAWFWCPELQARARWERDRIPYELWCAQGWIKATPGNVTDYDQVHADIRKIGEVLTIKEIAVDPWHAAQLSTQLQADGFEIVDFGQGYGSMAAPVNRLLEIVAGAQLEHGNNPILNWMASNAVTAEDPAGNLKFDKSRSVEKIDGIVSLTMALGRAMQEPATGEGGFEAW